MNQTSDKPLPPYLRRIAYSEAKYGDPDKPQKGPDGDPAELVQRSHGVNNIDVEFLKRKYERLESLNKRRERVIRNNYKQFSVIDFVIVYVQGCNDCMIVFV